MAIVDDLVTVLSPDGKIEREISLYELLGDRIPPARLDAIAKGEPWAHGVRAADVFHTNAVEVLERDLWGLPTAGDVLVCIRELDLLAVLDLDARRVEWSWGPGVLARPHSPTLVSGGGVLVFDNGKGRGYSRILEVDPRRGEVAWEYRADPPGSFFTSNQGASQPLANGNVLITESKRGHAFEVTREGRIVWEFYNPDVEDGRRGIPNSVTRIDPRRAEPHLAAR